MKLEYSGNVYKFPLDFNLGYAYAEILDFSDISNFDGILIQVFKIVEIDKEVGSNRSIEEIKRTGIMFGPAPVNKYPKKMNKGGWELVGKDQEFDKSPPLFKHLRGLLIKNNWSNLKPWFKQNRFDDKVDDVECQYEEVRHLETVILNHLDSIKTKITMMKIIQDKERVDKFYDLKNLGYKNLFLQIANTYYPKITADTLLVQHFGTASD